MKSIVMPVWPLHQAASNIYTNGASQPQIYPAVACLRCCEGLGGGEFRGLDVRMRRIK